MRNIIKSDNGSQPENRNELLSRSVGLNFENGTNDIINIPKQA